MAGKFYILAVGDYEEERPIGIFSEDQKGIAERIAWQLHGHTYGPFDLNRPKVEIETPPPGSTAFFEITLLGNGKVHNRAKLSLLHGDDDYLGKLRVERYQLAKSRNRWRLLVCCYADTEEHAIERAQGVRKGIQAGRFAESGMMRDIS